MRARRGSISRRGSGGRVWECTRKECPCTNGSWFPFPVAPLLAGPLPRVTLLVVPVSVAVFLSGLLSGVMARLLSEGLGSSSLIRSSRYVVMIRLLARHLNGF